MISLLDKYNETLDAAIDKSRGNIGLTIRDLYVAAQECAISNTYPRSIAIKQALELPDTNKSFVATAPRRSGKTRWIINEAIKNFHYKYNTTSIIFSSSESSGRLISNGLWEALSTNVFSEQRGTRFTNSHSNNIVQCYNAGVSRSSSLDLRGLTPNIYSKDINIFIDEPFFIYEENIIRFIESFEKNTKFKIFALGSPPPADSFIRSESIGKLLLFVDGRAMNKVHLGS